MRKDFNITSIFQQTIFTILQDEQVEILEVAPRVIVVIRMDDEKVIHNIQSILVETDK